MFSVLLGEAVLLHRDQRNLSQAEVARRVGVQQQTVSRWESGAAVPPPARTMRLEDVLKVERGTLLRLAGYLPADDVTSLVDVRAMLAHLLLLNDDQLVLVIETAWQIHRERSSFAENRDEDRLAPDLQ